MASERGNFYRDGPYFLTTIDWNNSHHRRSIAASLVQGVYVHEHDRKHNRKGSQALAPPWWEFFNFSLFQELVDDRDASYFGAIFKFKSSYYPNLGQPPRYVFASRGMIMDRDNVPQDVKQILKIYPNQLYDNTRFHKGIESVQSFVNNVGPENVWLAGHSLGSSLALIIGRDMLQSKKIHLETYLFNPPFILSLTESIKNDKLKQRLMVGKSFLKAGLAKVVNAGKKTRVNESFTMLSSWIPNLYINPGDHICSGYGGYFEHREKMESIGAGKIARIATQYSTVSTVSAAIIKNTTKHYILSEAIHLIPSAYLTTNSGPSQSFNEAHGIEQWWKQDLDLQCKLYKYE